MPRSRLEILEIDEDGVLQADYWNDFEEPFEANDFAVIEKEGRLKFFVSRSRPPFYDNLVLSSSGDSPGHHP